MKFKLLKTLIPVITASSAAIAIIPLASCTTKSKDETKTKTGLKLNLKARPNEIDINSTCVPMTIATNCDCNIVIPNKTLKDKVSLHYRLSYTDPEYGEQWYDPVAWDYASGSEGADTITVTAGHKVQLFGFSTESSVTAAPYLGAFSNATSYMQIKIVAKKENPNNNIVVGGNVASLMLLENRVEVSWEEITGCDFISSPHCFEKLFAESSITEVSPNFLTHPGTQPTSQINFYGALPEYAFKDAFSGCASLKRAPILPATKTHIPTDYENPVEGLPKGCYEGMFRGCVSLNTAPSLPALKFGEDCYKEIYEDCVTLNSISISYVGNFKDKYFENWTRNVSTKGVIRYSGWKDGQAISSSALPEGWDVKPIVDCPIVTIKTDSEATSKLTLEDGETTVDQYKTAVYADQTYSDVEWQLPTVSATNTSLTIDNLTWYSGDETTSIATGSEIKTKTFTDILATATDNILVPIYEEPSEWNLGYFNIKTRTGMGSTYIYAFERNSTSTGQLIQYSDDNGANWKNVPIWTKSLEDPTAATDLVEIPAGKTYLFKGNLNDHIQTDPYKNLCLRIANKGAENKRQIDFGGTFMSLIYNNDMTTAAQIENNKTIPTGLAFPVFFQSFYDTTTSPEPSTYIYKNFLPAINLPDPTGPQSTGCYQYMFQSLGSCVQTVPNLPAKTVPEKAYNSMFMTCGITTAPKISATKLGPHAMDSMFESCKSLKVAPELKATQHIATSSNDDEDGLPKGCYYQMFDDCTALTTACELPATKLLPDEGASATTAQGNYEAMFDGCTCLTQVPSILPATDIPMVAYKKMFYNCKAIETAPKISAITTNYGSFQDMFYCCTSLQNVTNFSSLTTVGKNTFERAFYKCTSLVNAPDVPALTNIAAYCFNETFRYCSNLKKPMVIPKVVRDTVLDDPGTTHAGIYNSMYYSCTSLYEKIGMGSEEEPTAGWIPFFKITSQDEETALSSTVAQFMFVACANESYMTASGKSPEWNKVVFYNPN